jgi:ABC-type sugar transport system ATPase subunit
VSSANVIETSSLGKRYGRFWALRECTFSAPEGHLAALVGPNGAGKTTLLHLLVGLMTATAGTVTVLGGQPAGSRAALDGIAFARAATIWLVHRKAVVRARLAVTIPMASHRGMRVWRGG